MPFSLRCLNPFPKPAQSPALRWGIHEWAGGLGDLGTFLPLALLLAAYCDMNFGWLLIMAGAMNILSGWWFKQPIPVQPMKALAALAIASSLSPGAIMTSGIGMGIALLILAMSGSIHWLTKYIPKALVNGIQLGVGANLIIKGFTGTHGHVGLLDLDWHIWQQGPLWMGCAIVLGMGLWRKWPTILLVFGAGLLIAGVQQGMPNWHVPTVSLFLPTTADWRIGISQGMPAQLPLTLLNSVIAVCALSETYYPKQGIRPRDMALSVAWMNLLCVPLGGMPMCHGSGGLAAQYRFGARSGGSAIILGALKIIAGLLFGAGLAHWFSAFPGSILSVMMVCAGIGLALAGIPKKQAWAITLTLGTASAIIAFGTLIGFSCGVGIALIGALVLMRRKPTHSTHDKTLLAPAIDPPKPTVGNHV